jgi:hypothetical protein
MPNLFTKLTIAAALALCGSAHAFQVPAEEVLDKRIADERVQLLDSESFAQRQEATASLLSDSTISLQTIETWLADPSLSPEQHMRLLHVGRARFALMPRGGLGVQFGVMEIDGGAAISRTVEGFDAANWLQAGDVIIEVDGRPVRSSGDLRMEIISRTPGEALPLRVNRVGEIIEVAPKLGDYSALGNPAPLSLGELMLAWQMRLQRQGAEQLNEQVIRIESDINPMLHSGRDQAPRMVVGGSVRNVSGYRGVRQVQGGVEFRAEFGVVEMAQIDRTQLQIDAIKQRLIQLELTEEQINERLVDAQNEERVQLEELKVRIRSQIDGLNKTLQTIVQP